MVEDRIAALEDHAATLEQRVRDLEAERRSWAPPRTDWPLPTPSAPPRAARPMWTPPAVSPAATRPAKPKRDLEDVLGGSVLAWLGGVAILAGLAFLLTIAISRGWLGEGARTVLAGLLSAGLLGTGIWLREHKDRTEAALAAAAVGVAGLFGTILIAGAVYELVPTTVALAGAFVVGSVATYLATRWNATLMGWLGLLGALLAPAALGAIEEGVVYLAIAYTATIAVVVWQRWNALAWAAFVLATLQFAAWADGAESVVAVLAVFGVLNAALALGLEARRPGLNLNTAFLLAANAALLVLGHWDEHWFIAIAAAHAIAGLALIRAPRISRPAALITLGIGVGLADLALASLTSGLPVVLGWAGPVLAFAALLGARRRPAAMDQFAAELRTTFTLSPTAPAAPGAAPRDFAPRHRLVARICDAVLGRPAAVDWYFAALGLIAQLVLAIGHTLATEAPLDALAGTAPTTEALVAVATVGAIAFLAARLSGVFLLDVLALTALAQFTGLTLEGLPLTLALAAEAGLLALISQRASLAFAALAAGHALCVLAPPIALLDGLDHPYEAAAGLLAVTAALLATTHGRKLVPVALLYLASVEVVTIGGPEHAGQTLLSVLWALSGVGALIYGLVKDHKTTRLVGLGLIAVTAAKVFVYDLSELDSLARVASFIVFGILLLLGAFAWQRVRPRPLP